VEILVDKNPFFLNKPDWYGLERTEKLAQAYEKFFEFNL